MRYNTKIVYKKPIAAILFSAIMVLSIFSGVALADNSDHSNEIPPDFQNRKSSSVVQDTLPIVSNPLSENSSDAKASSTLAIDVTLADMINNFASSYYHDFWDVSLSQYKAWIALITLREAGYGRYVAHSQWGGGYDGDRFNHVDAGGDFRFSTGIGAFQLDRGGSQGDASESWSTMPTIDKLDPEKSLFSALRWHQDRFGDSDTWTGATLADFSQYSAWCAVQPSNEDNFITTWNTITGHTWNECKNTKLEVNFDPPTVTDPLENNVRYIGSVYWNLLDDCFDTWLITARRWNGNVVTQYYYAYNDMTGLEMWVWNDPDHKFIYRFARRYTTTHFPENRIDTGGIADAGTTDDEAALDPTKPCFSLDLIFTIDTTGSMWDDIDYVKASASAIVDEIFSDIPTARIAVVDYRDFPISPYGDPGDYPFNDDLTFSTDKLSIIAAIQGLMVGGGADWRESVYSALMHSIDSTSLGGWRGSDQAAKAIILMGDAPPHDPEPFTGYTLSSVVTAAENADPVLIYPIQIGGAVEKFEELADQTGGEAFTAENAGEVVAAILEAIEEIKTKPVAVANGPYSGYVGSPITFDGTGSYDLDGTIVSYEWDLDDDGEFDDAVGATPTVSFTAPYSGNIHLKVTDNDGATDTDSTTLTITKHNPPIADANGPYTGVIEYIAVPITFDGTGSYATDPAGTITSYNWDLDNDGEFDDAVGATPTVSFTAPHSSNIHLKVTDNNGATDTDSTTLTITKQSPPPDGIHGGLLTPPEQPQCYSGTSKIQGSGYFTIDERIQDWATAIDTTEHMEGTGEFEMDSKTVLDQAANTSDFYDPNFYHKKTMQFQGNATNRLINIEKFESSGIFGGTGTRINEYFDVSMIQKDESSSIKTISAPGSGQSHSFATMDQFSGLWSIHSDWQKICQKKIAHHQMFIGNFSVQKDLTFEREVIAP